jgi:ubiquitin-conjugating enzyme E2 O
MSGSGDKNEIWSAARSSLLQAFVSIQGLVLVKEPYVYIIFPKPELDKLILDNSWYCEPAYEKLRGTEEGTVNRFVTLNISARLSND